MTRILVKKFAYEARLLWLSCAAMLYLFCSARVWLVGRLEMSRFRAVFEQLREFEKFSPVPFDQLFTYTGRIAMTFDEPIVIICLVVWAISRGSDSVSGEIGRGTMEMLLAQPVSRLRVLLSQASVTVIGAALLCMVVWLGIYTGVMNASAKEEVPPTLLNVPGLFSIPNPVGETEIVYTPMKTKTEMKHFVPGAVNLFALTFFLAGLSTLMSSWDRYRWRTIGIVVGIYVVQLTMKIVGMAGEDLAWLMNFSFFSAYEPQAFTSISLSTPADTWSLWRVDTAGEFTGLGPLGYNLILIGQGIVFYATAAVVFCRRDLPAPL